MFLLMIVLELGAVACNFYAPSTADTGGCKQRAAKEMTETGTGVPGGLRQ